MLPVQLGDPELVALTELVSRSRHCEPLPRAAGLAALLTTLLPRLCPAHCSAPQLAVTLHSLYTVRLLRPASPLWAQAAAAVAGQYSGRAELALAELAETLQHLRAQVRYKMSRYK